MLGYIGWFEVVPLTKQLPLELPFTSVGSRRSQTRSAFVIEMTLAGLFFVDPRVIGIIHQMSALGRKRTIAGTTISLTHAVVSLEPDVNAAPPA